MTESIQIIPDPVTGDLMVDVLAHLDMVHHELMDQKVLDHGFVRILDVMPRLVPVEAMNCDFALADAARISYQKGTRKVSSDRGLVDHLTRNRHTSPIEMGELKFHLRMPIFVMRQHVRHRMASLNEESARYSELASDFYIPDAGHWALQLETNKQATEHNTNVTWDLASFLHDKIKDHNKTSYALYQLLLGDRPKPGDDATAEEISTYQKSESKLWEDLGVPPVAREQARMILGVNIYTQCVWKIDLKNLLHYISLRCDPHAQFEIRCLADPISRVTEALFPGAFASFKDHFIDGVNFGKSELGIVRSMTTDYAGGAIENQLADTLDIIDKMTWSQSRLVEFSKKLKRSGLVHEDRIAALLVAYKRLLDSRKSQK